jgi:hypothetical protein
MLEYDEAKGIMTWKIVYYGPALSGKTTNLLALHDLISQARRGEMMQADTKDDRTLFFDLLPLAYRTPSGAKLKIKVFTVPGQVQYNATRKSVLMRADGIVFVADSQKSQTLHNSESFANLEDNAFQAGLLFDAMPLVVQFNKRDLSPQIIAGEKEILARWKSSNVPLFFASALHGAGVMETFSAVVSGVCRFMDQQFQISERLGIQADDLIAYLSGNDRDSGAPESAGIAEKERSIA